MSDKILVSLKCNFILIKNLINFHINLLKNNCSLKVYIKDCSHWISAFLENSDNRKINTESSIVGESSIFHISSYLFN